MLPLNTAPLCTVNRCPDSVITVYRSHLPPSCRLVSTRTVCRWWLKWSWHNNGPVMCAAKHTESTTIARLSIICRRPVWRHTPSIIYPEAAASGQRRQQQQHQRGQHGGGLANTWWTGRISVVFYCDDLAISIDADWSLKQATGHAPARYAARKHRRI